VGGSVLGVKTGVFIACRAVILSVPVVGGSLRSSLGPILQAQGYLLIRWLICFISLSWSACGARGQDLPSYPAYNGVHVCFRGLYTVIAWQGFRKLSGEFELDETMFGGHRLGKRGLGVEGKHIVLDGEHILHRRIRRIHWISGQRKAHTRKEGKRANPQQKPA